MPKQQKFSSERSTLAETYGRPAQPLRQHGKTPAASASQENQQTWPNPQRNQPASEIFPREGGPGSGCCSSEPSLAAVRSADPKASSRTTWSSRSAAPPATTASIGKAVHVHVQDNGVGIPAGKLDAVFQPFFQVESSTVYSSRGTGLGLAISRELARAMGGDLNVESAFGAGSTFTLCLQRHLTD